MVANKNEHSTCFVLSNDLLVEKLCRKFDQEGLDDMVKVMSIGDEQGRGGGLLYLLACTQLA